MVFSSSTFLFVFLPIALGVYFIVPKRQFRNVWLLVVSLCFYAWGEPVYVLLMLLSIVVNYTAARVIDKASGDGGRKAAVVVAIVFNLCILGFFKYESFLATNVNALLGTTLIPDLQLPLPIGISFYTLQSLSYIIDVYRKDVPPQRNILYLGMYISCFPQLIAGPIVRYQTVVDQILNRKETLSDFASGLRLFCIGLAKKVLLANVCAILADTMLDWGGASIGLIGSWAGIIACTFQLFFDFSGYSDMAIGLGRMMGFKYLRNFNYPFIAKSIAELWRRWHISLYTFFRDYLYIPLGGSRVSSARWIFNMFVVWSLTGLWHGATWNCVIWGLYFGVLLIGEKCFWGKALSKAPAAIGIIYTDLLFLLGYFVFWVGDFSVFKPYVKALVGMYGLTGKSTMWELMVWEYVPVFIVCILASTPIVPWLREKLFAWAEGRKSNPITGEGQTAHFRSLQADELCAPRCNPENSKKKMVVDAVRIAVDIALVLLFIASCASVAAGSYNPFIYFQF